MTSGVKCSDKVKDICDKMRLVKSDADHMKRIRVVVFTIKDGEIDVDECYCEEQLAEKGKDGFALFQEMMADEKCCYILYDCHFDTKECRNKQELVFLTWCSEKAGIKEKMVYASSKDSIKKCVGSIKHNIQMTEKADCVNRASFAEKLGKGIISLEGVSCLCDE